MNSHQKAEPSYLPGEEKFLLAELEVLLAFLLVRRPSLEVRLVQV